MATTNYGVNHPLAVKLWSRKLFHEALKQTWAYKFIGRTSNSLLYYKEDLSKSAGDRVRVGLRLLLTGDGIQGDGTLEGNEEALTTHFDDLLINQLRHAVRVGGRMSQQRVPFSIREEARDGLQDWWADRFDTWFFNQISGNSGASDTRRTGHNGVTEPDTSHIFACGPLAALHTTEASLSATTTHALKLSDIDRAVAKAKTFEQPSVPIRPIKAMGGEYYCLFIHPFQTYQLRTDAGTNNWADIQKAALQGGNITKSPIFTGAIGMHNNVVIHESTRVPVITGTPASGAAADYRRAIFAGAQAACLGVGQGENPNKMTWVEELFDYENQLGVAAGQISGMKKSIFNSQDFATIAVSGYAPAV